MHGAAAAGAISVSPAVWRSKDSCSRPSCSASVGRCCGTKGHVADEIRRTGERVDATVIRTHESYRLDSIDVEHDRAGSPRRGQIVVPSVGHFETGAPIILYVVADDPDRLSTAQGYTSVSAWRVQLAITLTGAGALIAAIVLLRGGWSLVQSRTSQRRRIRDQALRL